jgi:hypothetical protein
MATATAKAAAPSIASNVCEVHQDAAALRLLRSRRRNVAQGLPARKRDNREGRPGRPSLPSRPLSRGPTRRAVDTRR